MKKYFGIVILIGAFYASVEANGANTIATPDSTNVYSVYVALDGNDKDPGTKDKPVASVKRAVELIRDKKDPSEIILRKGVYPGDVELGRIEDRLAVTLPRLVIRPAMDEKTGEFEEVIFDGGMEIKDAEVVTGMTGVYKTPGRFTDDRAEFQVWESDTRKRYTRVAAMAAVEQFPASFSYTEKEIVFHTSDNKPPREHRMGVSRFDIGIQIWRANTIVKGLRFRNFLLKYWSSGVFIRGANSMVEDCHVANSSWGFQGSSWGEDISATGMKVIRCRADDVGGGVYCSSRHVVVEDCRFFKIRDGFMVPAYPQNDCGIQYYAPAVGGEVHRNLCVGFMNGIFVKTSTGDDEFIVENNTVLDGLQNGIGCTGWGWKRKAVFRLNVVTGFTWPILGPKEIQAQPMNIVDYNCFWNALIPDVMKVCLEEPRKVGQGIHNIYADPRFAAPSVGDYRLLPDSPYLKMGPSGEVCGAFVMVGPDFKDVQPPDVKLTVSAPAKQAGGTGELYFERDPWIGGGRNLIRQLPPEGEGKEWITPKPDVTLEIDAQDAVSRPDQMKVKVGKEDWGKPEPYQSKRTVTLPAGTGMAYASMQVSDMAGNWSKSTSVLIRLAATGPKLLKPPIIYTNSRGAVISFETDSACFASMEFGKDQAYGTILKQQPNVQRTWLSQDGGEWVEIRSKPLVTNFFVLLAPVVTQGQVYHYRLVLEDENGNKTLTADATFKVKGEPKMWHVSPAGTDVEEKGTKEQPWRTIQFAVDRALPGDRVVLLPGLYTGEAMLTHGGLENAPITIAAEKPGTVILDGRKTVKACLRLEKAPFVVIDGLEARWFERSGVYIADSPNVSVARCRIWNNFWAGYPIGSGIFAQRSPGFVAEQNVIFSIEQGICLLESPRSRILRNTITGNMYGAVQFIFSAADSVCKNNCFAFSGNDQYVVENHKKEEFQTFVSDYNNLGTQLRQANIKPGDPNLQPEEATLKTGSKAIIGLDGKRYCNLQEWSKETGKDQHSIFAHPKFKDPMNRDFRIGPDSPNVDAGENGVTIGAYDPEPTPAAK